MDFYIVNLLFSVWLSLGSKTTWLDLGKDRSLNLK